MEDYTLTDAVSELSSDVFQLKQTMLTLIDSLNKIAEIMQNKTEQHSEN